MLNVPANFESLQLHSDFGAGRTLPIQTATTTQATTLHRDTWGKTSTRPTRIRYGFFFWRGFTLVPGNPRGVVERSNEEPTDGRVLEKKHF